MELNGFKGIIPAVTIAYDKQGRVSPRRLEQLYEFLIQGGVDGLFVGGSTGEWPLLTVEERKLATQVALDTAKGRVPVLMHIGSMFVDQVVDYAVWAKQAGVAAVSIVMPYYFTYDEEGLARYFDAILPKIELPVILYNIPGNVKNPLTVSLYKRLTQDYPVVAGVKDSSMDFLHIQEYKYAIPELTYFTGNDAQILPCLMWGGNGAISATAGVFPEVVTRMNNLYQTGDFEGAKEIQNKIMEYRSFVVSHPALSVVKAALELRGFATGGLRMPLHDLSETHRVLLKELLERLEFPLGSI